ncbi:MAG: (deoxy)nucleoside triphosphate pyrophosphohydrolase [Desulfuromonas sp.]|nr:(deoxy)nucleoside triphosphate pyrophosphohydrolase [Desulfuromonas sp.]
MKKIKVACAIIVNNGLVLAAQRSEKMSLPLKWEFPGGKLEPQENAADCLVREIKEELDVNIEILSSLAAANWQYPDFFITLYPFVCTLLPGKLSLIEHKRILWLKPQNLLTLDWAEADITIIQNYLESLSDGDHSQ